MAGAFVFALALVAVLTIGTYLLQGAILLLQAAIWAAVWALRIVWGLGCAVFVGVWWLVDRPAAREALRLAEERERALRPAG